MTLSRRQSLASLPLVGIAASARGQRSDDAWALAARIRADIVVPRFPCRRFFTGAIHLRSNVNLHLAEGATVRFSTDPEHYLPAVFTRWEGVEYYGYSPLVYAYRAENVAVTGRGVLDGQASNETWWARLGAAHDATIRGNAHVDIGQTASLCRDSSDAVRAARACAARPRATELRRVLRARPGFARAP